MNPAWSVVLLTTLIGAGQGLFLALFAAELAGAPRALLVIGGAVSLLLTALGLAASFFHLGRPERAWRSAAMWRSSWLSREVIALPAFLAALLAWAAAHALGMGAGFTRALGAATLLLAAALFVCTAMVYASVRFLQEWASAFTLVNVTLLGTASGFTLCAALAAGYAPALAPMLAGAALVFTLAGLVTRSLSLARNARLAPRSTPQSAIGIRHPRIVQKSQGFTGSAFNTREFFHGRSPGALRQVKWGFIGAAFVVPALLLAAALTASSSAALLAAAFVVQYLGLLAERWFFLAQANHPQNLYYQAVS